MKGRERQRQVRYIDSDTSGLVRWECEMRWGLSVLW